MTLLTLVNPQAPCLLLNRRRLTPHFALLPMTPPITTQ